MFEQDVLLNKIVSQYSKIHPEISLDIKKFNKIDEYMIKLSGEVMAGEGPDVVFFNSYSIGSIYKLINIGVFTNLEPFINNNKDFDIEDYNTKVLECGVFDKKRLFIPFDYKISVFSSTKEVLKENNINIDTEGFTSNDFFKKIDPYILSIQQKKDKYLFSSVLPLGEYVFSSGISLVDYKNKRVFFDDQEFEELIKSYKKIYKMSAQNGIREKYLNQEYDMLKDRDTLFINGGYAINPNDLMFSNSLVTGLLGETEVIYPWPKYNGSKKYVAIVDNCLAINNNSENKKNAFDFIKVALSQKIQEDNNMHNLPVNDRAKNNLITKNKTRQEERIIYNDRDIVLKPIPDELLTNYTKIINNIESCSYIDCYIEGLMYQALVPYLEDKASLENSIKELKNKTMLYLNE